MTDIDTSPEAVEALAAYKEALADKSQRDLRALAALLRQPAKERDEAIALATEVADDLEALVEDQYKDTKHYPSELRRYKRDIDPVRRVRALKDKQP